MSVTQTVEVPVNHRLTIDVPQEIPAGPVILTFKPAAVQRTDAAKPLPVPDVLPGGSYSTIEEALEAAAKKAADPNRKPISRFFGILSPGTYGDGVAYQRKLRDEWDD